MTDDAFLESLDAAGRWLTDYWRKLPDLPVVAAVKPGETIARLPDDPPEEPELDLALLAGELDRVIVPGLTHWQHPRFFAYFPANSSPPAILGELLSAGLGVQGMLWLTSPACTEVETRMLDWLRVLLGLPECFDSRASAGAGGGVIQGTASESTLVAMVAARDRARRAIRAVSPGARPEFCVYASTQAHSSVLKAAMICGIADDASDTRHVRLIPTDDRFAMDPAALGAAIAHDAAAGLVPCFVCATIGSTGTTAIDPLPAIAGVIAAANGPAPIWLHADAAHSGSALVCPELRWMSDGAQHADSFCFNPHKWLLTNFDCGCFFVKDHRHLLRALSVTPEYLRNKESDAGRVIDYRDWQVPLGRRFRALKLWLVIRHYGARGLREHIRRHIRLAELFESLVAGDPRLELCAPRTVNLVCFRKKADDAENRRLLDALNATGRMFLTHTQVPETSAAPSRLVLRMAIGGVRTTEDDVREAWRLIQSLA